MLLNPPKLSVYSMLILACVASGSARVRCESSNESEKKGNKGEGGREKGEKEETLAGKLHDFEKRPFFHGWLGSFVD